MKKRIVIVGGTSTIAEHCARLWVTGDSVDVTLVGRNEMRMNRVAADLRIRSTQSFIRTVLADFYDPVAIQDAVNNIVSQGPVDTVLIAHGELPDQNLCQNNLATCRQALEVNGISPILYAEAFAGHMAKVNQGTLAIISSVAGDRGRKSNYVYGAAKGMVTRYAQGLQHRFAGSGIKIVLVKPGPTDTPMTAHLKKDGAKLAPVTEVAKEIVRAIYQGQAVVYVPRIWQLIMWVIRHIPAVIFNKMNI